MDQFPYIIRPIRPEKDAAEIARLVRVSFRPWLDDDNMRYLARLENAGVSALEHPFWSGLSGFPFDITGIVCTDQDGKVIGVINTYYFHLSNRKCCLIANVCVDPAHRGERIASRMLQEAERSERGKGSYGIFLQSRVEKTDVTEMYRKNGYQVTDYRECWIYPLDNKGRDVGNLDLRLERVPPQDRNVFERQFHERYPTSVLWNLDYRQDLFSFGRIGEIENLLFGRGNCFRRVTDPLGCTLAWTAYQAMKTPSDILWFIPNHNLSDNDYSQTLRFVCKEIAGKKPIRVDVPSESGTWRYKEAGLSMLHRLAWMWKKL